MGGETVLPEDFDNDLLGKISTPIEGLPAHSALHIPTIWLPTGNLYPFDLSDTFTGRSSRLGHILRISKGQPRLSSFLPHGLLVAPQLTED